MWTEADRQIYQATIAGVTRWFDPEAVRRRLTLYTRGKLNDLLQAANRLQDVHDDQGNLVTGKAEEGSPEHLAALDAMGHLAAAAIAAFDLIPFDPETGAGCLEGEAQRLLADFLAWLRSKKAPGAVPHS